MVCIDSWEAGVGLEDVLMLLVRWKDGVTVDITVYGHSVVKGLIQKIQPAYRLGPQVAGEFIDAVLETVQELSSLGGCGHAGEVWKA